MSAKRGGRTGSLGRRNRRNGMVQNNDNGRLAAHFDDEAINDEGGLRAPPHLHGWQKAWWWFHFLILVKLARLRFIAILLLIGVVITQWDTLVAYYEKWTRRKDAAAATA